MSGTEILGFIAAVLTTGCWLPQALKTIRTKETKSISLLAQSSFLAGIVLWFTYGVLVGSWPIILANAVSFLIVGLILAMKLRYG